MIMKYYFIIVMSNITAEIITYQQRYHRRNKENFLIKKKEL